MGFLRSSIKNVTKITLVALAVKYAADNGVWSLNSEEGASLFANLRSTVLPGTIVYGEELPSSDVTRRSLGAAWNRNVNCAFGTLRSASNSLSSTLHKMADALPSFDDTGRQSH
ncbi:hypothetical protein GPALN_006382 [Globodera pallida]|uniref:MICOS complex subunit MIC13 n=1 Tax=Globodera rostochiensis TaxID=31243 RepID=A0A914HUP1_GLORO|nr:hypothetical protein GPALN_006382 [Globodera pallida]